MASAAAVVTLNVGGELFQTTVGTLARAGTSSPLSSLSPSTPADPHFLDCDPRLFALLLSFLRRGRLLSPPTAALLAEARHFALDGALLASLSPASAFAPLSLRPSALVPLTGRVAPSAVAMCPSPHPASVVAAHGGVVTCFDAALASRCSVLTPLPAVDSLVAVSPDLAFAGAHDFPSVHICRFSDAAAPEGLSWPGSSSATVLSMEATAVSEAATLPWLFTSFESARRNSSAVVVFDLSSLSPVVEIGRKEVFGADVEAAIPATKLRWLGEHNLLLAAGSHSGPGGVLGDIRLWDVRASSTVPVWEVREKDDCFSDIDASDKLSALFKVGAASGELFMADLRKLDNGGTIGLERWVCIGDEQRVAAASPSGRKGNGCMIECYSYWVFVARGSDVEVWSQVELASEAGGKKVMRRNWVGNGPPMETGGSEEGVKEKTKIVSWAFGGSRMALARAEKRSIEVWYSAPAAICIDS
jgi:hypothetical protein